MPPDFDLKTGYPDLALVPHARLLEHIGAIFDEGRGMQYGGSLQGISRTREVIGGFLSRMLHAHVPPDELIIVPGTLFAIDMICRTAARPGDVVLVESPTFYYAVNLLRMSGVEIVGVPLSADGIDLDALDDKLTDYAGRVRLLYTIPTYHNPTGLCASADNRAGVVALAAKHDVLVLEDATYQPLYYAEPPPPALKTFDSGGEQVVLAASVSKILMPSLRLGWVWASPAWVKRFMAHKSDGATSSLTSAVVVDFIRSGEIDGQLDHARALYKRKHDRVVETLRAHAPDWLRWNAPNGGYFIWATLPDRLSASQVEAAALARGVAVMRGSEAYVQPPNDQMLRLCFAMLPDDQLAAAVETLCEVLRTL
jgi:DNA-binding transcriptional MocR family regulator